MTIEQKAPSLAPFFVARPQSVAFISTTLALLTKVWLDAGLESEQVDMEKRKPVFKRVRTAKGKGGADEEFIHPAWGAMKGLIRIMPGVDITQPADPDLADYLDAKYRTERR